MMASLPQPRLADVLAGVSVALLLIPQSLAYAQIAGMPPVTGLFASALPLIACAPFVSSPYLQTGPVALTSLLTLAALQGAGLAIDDPDYVTMAALLAVMVGGFRLVLGLLRAGWVAYLIVQPVLLGFTSAAAVLILSSQLPKALGNSQAVPGSSTLGDALWSVSHPGSWHPAAIGLSIITLIVMLGGRRVHRLFPGVALAVVVGLAYSAMVADPGLVVGEPSGVPQGFPAISLDLPWGSVGTLIIGALIIALVGFAEPASIARIFADEDKTFWDANKELVSQGVANIVSGLSGAFPVGGSFSRSSVNRLAGAQTKWSGGITGLVVLAFLPFAGVLDPLPQAILGAIVVGAVLGLLKLPALVGLYRTSLVDAVLAWLTWGATLWLAPDIHWAVILGLVATIIVQLIRPVQVTGDSDRLAVTGLLWLGSHRRFERRMGEAIAERPGCHLIVDVGSSTIDPPLNDVLERLDTLAASGGGSLATAEAAESGS